MEDQLSNAAELPYFEGDFRPNDLEESSIELDQEEGGNRREAEAVEASDNAFNFYSSVMSCDMDGLIDKMEKLGLDLDDGSSPADQKQANPQEAKMVAIQRCVQSLVHACQCTDANCSLPRCQKLKRVVQHSKICKRKVNGDCPICKYFIELCCYHAKYCQETKCAVPFCYNIKYKIKQQQLKDRLHEAELLKNMLGMIMQPGPNAAAHTQALQQLLHTLRSPNTPEQQLQILHIIESNPELMAAYIRLRQNFQARQ